MSRTLQQALAAVSRVMFAGVLALGAAYGVLWGVLAGSASSLSAPCAPTPEALTARAVWWSWLRALQAPVSSLDWSCEPTLELLPALGESLWLTVTVLLVSLGLAVLVTVSEFRQPWRLRTPSSRLAPVLLGAPPVVWYSVTVCALSLLGVQGAIQGSDWLRFPLAVCALTLGGGCYWELRQTLRQSVARLLMGDMLTGARANALPLPGRVYRHVRGAVLEQQLGRLPQLLGEAVIVEWVVKLPGLGTYTVSRLSSRDAPALMSLAACVVLLTALVRTLSGSQPLGGDTRKEVQA